MSEELAVLSKTSPLSGLRRPVLPQTRMSNAIVLLKGTLTVTLSVAMSNNCYVNQVENAISTHTFHLLQVDVYVNTAASSLELSNGAVAKSLRKSGGPKLQEECTQYTQANGDIKVWEFATTRGHKLKCKHVIHTVGANYDGQGGRAKKVRFPKLRAVV